MWILDGDKTGFFYCFHCPRQPLPLQIWRLLKWFRSLANPITLFTFGSITATHIHAMFATQYQGRRWSSFRRSVDIYISLVCLDMYAHVSLTLSNRGCHVGTSMDAGNVWQRNPVNVVAIFWPCVGTEQLRTVPRSCLCNTLEVLHMDRLESDVILPMLSEVVSQCCQTGGLATWTITFPMDFLLWEWLTSPSQPIGTYLLWVEQRHPGDPAVTGSSLSFG